MILALDVGNSQIFGGLFDQDKIVFNFRKSSRDGVSSDELGVFFKNVLQSNGFDPLKVKHVALCSVVPELIHSIKGSCQKYFNTNPFILQAGVKTGLKIKYRNPVEVGADRIANAIAAVEQFPGKPLIIVDFGTATTFDVVTADRDYLGGLIIPGFRLSMESLESGTSKLPRVEILKPTELVGRSTVESIQSGLYYGNLAMVREISNQINAQYFNNEKAILIGTGGFSRMFEKENLFDVFAPDLVLQGLYAAFKMNA
jgi:type III pantothenate kinase